ncbi:MAG TPA: hypothetical protein VD763_06670 [Candidatus Saccharimonadales bacterium]|nr:hypothetical protein [Candidatus Saccharimonadales bacterium]
MTTDPSTARGSVLAIVGLVFAIVTAGVVATVGALGQAAADPTASPTAPVSPIPSPSGAPRPSGAPTATPTQPVPWPGLVIELDTLTDHEVTVRIDDATGTLVEARSGQPGDGMSVRWFDVKVENLDAETIRLTWVGLPFDTEIGLGISRQDDGYRLRIVQPGPPADSDAMGFDRELVLRFDAPVRAEDVQADIQEGDGTAD